MQSSSQSWPGVCQIYTNSNCPQTDNGQRTRDCGHGTEYADYWSWLLYEDWPETRFRLRPITRAGHRATLATCNYQNFHGSIIMGSGALQLCRPININTAGGGSGTCGGQWRGGGERRERERAPHVQRLHMRLVQRPFMQFIVFDGIQCAKASQVRLSQAKLDHPLSIGHLGDR